MSLGLIGFWTFLLFSDQKIIKHTIKFQKTDPVFQKLCTFWWFFWTQSPV